MRVLFYTHSARAFTSTLVGNLYEIAQAHPVVVVAEPLPTAYLDLLGDRGLFPRLEGIVPVQCLEFSVGAMVRNNRRWLRLARSLIEETRPAVLVGENDMMSLFEMYLMRAAKCAGVATLTIQAMMEFRERDNIVHNRLLHLFPEGRTTSRPVYLARRVKTPVMKTAGHFLVHFLLPWSLGQPALRGKSSYIKWRGASGLRDGDLNLVLTAGTFLEYEGRGVPARKLAVLRHPLTRAVPRRLYLGAAANDSGPEPAPPLKNRMLVLMGFLTLGFDKGTHDPIPTTARQESFQQIVATIRRVLPGWEVWIKPHPNWGTAERAAGFLGPLEPGITLVEPTRPVEPLLGTAQAILDLPPAATSTLFTASCAFPDKPIIAADVLQEFYGDNYRDFPGIDYVGTYQEMEGLLTSIGNGTFRKKAVVAPRNDRLREFPDTNAALASLINGDGVAGRRG